MTYELEDWFEFGYGAGAQTHKMKLMEKRDLPVRNAYAKKIGTGPKAKLGPTVYFDKATTAEQTEFHKGFTAGKRRAQDDYDIWVKRRPASLARQAERLKILGGKQSKRSPQHALEGP